MALAPRLGDGSVQGYGVDPEQFADSVYKDILSGEQEIGFEYTKGTADKTRRELEQGAVELSKRFRPPKSE